MIQIKTLQKYILKIIVNTNTKPTLKKEKTHSYHKLFQKHECPKVNTIQRIRKLVITKMLIQKLGLKWRIKKKIKRKEKKKLFQYQELRNKCNGKSRTCVQILLPKKKKKKKTRLLT